MTDTNILITWMDGEQQVFKNVSTNVINGVLHVHVYGGTGGGIQDSYHFPISNIRSWKPVPAAPGRAGNG